MPTITGFLRAATSSRARKSVGEFGAGRLRDGKFIFARELPGGILLTGR